MNKKISLLPKILGKKTIKRIKKRKDKKSVIFIKYFVLLRRACKKKKDRKSFGKSSTSIFNS